MTDEIRLGVPAGDEAVNLQVEELRVVQAVSPKVDAERVSDGVEITVEDYREQPQTVKLNDGETPVRGVDYWTEEDKEEIVSQATEATEQDVADLKSHVEELDDHVQRISPRASVSKTGNVSTFVVTDTDGETQVEIRDGEKGGPGDPGKPGQDGVSPTVTITEITGGHRITITDATGAHSADVMDGEGAVQDVQVNGTSVLQDGVANVPAATSNDYGATRFSASYGTSGYGTPPVAGISPATSADIKNGSANYKPISVARQHETVFYGLAKAAGANMNGVSGATVGIYPEAQKSAISEMLSGSVAVSGTTPTINALPGVRYVCGEVSTLDIVTPASGIVDVVFTSGATPTVLTVTPPTGMTMKWSNGFDPASLEANTVYEVNIADGCLGVAGTWS